ncbi:MAG: hypothetical protein K0R82_380, partial [Flavipsychrobacter sp.]|nr:hypothetical protein [Flavipsychrobacter sp.]
KQVQRVETSDGSVLFKKIFDSAAPEWKGRSNAAEMLETSVQLQPESIVIYARRYV